MILETPGWRTPRGFDVSSCVLDADATPPSTSFVAILGRNDGDVVSAAVGMRVAEANTYRELADVAAMLVFAAQHGRLAPKWPVIDLAGIADSRRNDRRLVATLDRNEFAERMLLPLEDQDRPTTRGMQARPKTLGVALRQVGALTTDANAWGFSTSRWGIPATEYGEPSETDLAFVESRALAMSEPPIDPMQLSEGFQKEIAAAVELGGALALSRLAALRAFYDRGYFVLMEAADAFYQEAFIDLANAEADGSLPGHIASALQRGSRLHSFLYTRSMEFGGDVFLWIHGPPEDPTLRRLLQPRAFEFAAKMLGAKWWSQLVLAIDADDSKRRSELVDQLHRLLALVAQDRALNGVSGHVRNNEHEDLIEDTVRRGSRSSDTEREAAFTSETFGDPRESPLEAAILSDVKRAIARLATDPVEGREVIAAMLHAKKLTYTQIGQRLGVSFSYAKKLADRGRRRMRENPQIADLFGS